MSNSGTVIQPPHLWSAGGGEARRGTPGARTLSSRGGRRLPGRFLRGVFLFAEAPQADLG